ncbi:DUF4391 domain-containing protein [Candidatus Symbiobacter mobilis]|uniref:Methyl-accepting chemotaxis protein n=1 Tax=Candidatus Symbiobacter mobilis CR TaxID=946483 RepID=U5NA67_9BURK|nr:DUF4391 domain-containing protein [Candidatus Symbiobacter mobilis]AGX88297.1 hypothetical protein Cenrod_2230 [Candidatus Symbiobacter mobilis CR]
MSQTSVGLTADQVVSALGLPAAAMVNQRVPKKLLLENGAPTAADRKLIQDHIEAVTWVAALKPANVGVPDYQDAQRTYLELAVLSVVLQDLGATDPQSTKVHRIGELLHRAIPYPVLLVLQDGDRLFMSLCHIRWAQKETDKTVLDGEHLFAMLAPDAFRSAFLAALALNQQPRADLFALYQGWMDTVSAWQAAAVSGRFALSESPAQATERRAALHRCRELDAQIASLRSAASKEKQVARQVAVNLEIKALLADRQRIAANV